METGPKTLFHPSYPDLSATKDGKLTGEKTSGFPSWKQVLAGHLGPDRGIVAPSRGSLWCNLRYIWLQEAFVNAEPSANTATPALGSSGLTGPCLTPAFKISAAGSVTTYPSPPGCL